MDMMRWRYACRMCLLSAALCLIVVLLPGASPAADLDVDQTLANSPFGVGANITFNNENIGTTSIGTVNQGGFINTVNTLLRLGVNAGASGVYNLTGGNLVGNNEVVGRFGKGAFTHSAGINTAPVVILGDAASGSGTYNLSGTGALIATLIMVGNSGSGIFTQAGGANTVGQLSVADAAGSSGTYMLSGGNLTVNFETIAFGGTATFIQTGGNHTVTFQLLTNFWPGSAGTFLLKGGSLNAATLGIGTGSFIQTGGTNSVGVGGLWLGFPPNCTFALLGGTCTVAGSYNQGPNGIFAPGIASPAKYAMIPVVGAANLGGTVMPVLQGGYIPKINQFFPGVITAKGGVSGTFSSVANQFITPVLYWQDLYTATTFDLLVKSKFNNPTLNLTHNQANVANTLDGLANSATGDLSNMLNAVAGLPSNSAVANAYQQISADKAAVLSTLAFAGANLQQRILSRRITDLRFGNREVGAAGGLPGSFNFNYSRDSGMMLAYNSSSLAGLITSRDKAGPAESQSRWGVYLDPALIFGSQKSSDDQTGFNFTIAGFNAGADYRVQDNLLVGLASGYRFTGTSFHGSSGGSVTANTWPLTAYVAYLPQSFYAYGSLGYALNLFNLERQLSFTDLNRTAKSSTTGNQLNAYGEAGYDLKLKRLVVTPVLSLAYSRLWVDGFTEDGAGALNLQVSSQSAQSLQTGLGAKIAAPMKRGSVTVVPQVYGSYQHEYSNSSRTLDARLSQTGSTFAFQTDSYTGQPHRNFAVLGANVNILTQQNLKVQLDYNAEVGRGSYTAHYVSAGARWEF
jgi:outer membrane autotransporter protein